MQGRCQEVSTGVGVGGRIPTGGDGFRCVKITYPNIPVSPRTSPTLFGKRSENFPSSQFLGDFPRNFVIGAGRRAHVPPVVTPMDLCVSHGNNKKHNTYLALRWGRGEYYASPQYFLVSSRMTVNIDAKPTVLYPASI